MDSDPATQEAVNNLHELMGIAGVRRMLSQTHWITLDQAACYRFRQSYMHNASTNAAMKTMISDVTRLSFEVYMRETTPSTEEEAAHEESPGDTKKSGDNDGGQRVGGRDRKDGVRHSEFERHDVTLVNVEKSAKRKTPPPPAGTKKPEENPKPKRRRRETKKEDSLEKKINLYPDAEQELESFYMHQFIPGLVRDLMCYGLAVIGLADSEGVPFPKPLNPETVKYLWDNGRRVRPFLYPLHRTASQGGVRVEFQYSPTGAIYRVWEEKRRGSGVSEERLLQNVMVFVEEDPDEGGHPESKVRSLLGDQLLADRMLAVHVAGTERNAFPVVYMNRQESNPVELHPDETIPGDTDLMMSSEAQAHNYYDSRVDSQYASSMARGGLDMGGNRSGWLQSQINSVQKYMKDIYSTDRATGAAPGTAGEATPVVPIPHGMRIQAGPVGTLPNNLSVLQEHRENSVSRIFGVPGVLWRGDPRSMSAVAIQAAQDQMEPAREKTQRDLSMILSEVIPLCVPLDQVTSRGPWRPGQTPVVIRFPRRLQLDRIIEIQERNLFSKGTLSRELSRVTGLSETAFQSPMDPREELEKKQKFELDRDSKQHEQEMEREKMRQKNEEKTGEKERKQEKPPVHQRPPEAPEAPRS